MHALTKTRTKTVYFNEYNVLLGGATYLPLVSGLLHAHALLSDKVKAAFSFAPYIFHIDSLENILAQYREPPAVAAFSVLMWNEQLSLAVAAEIKRRHPDCVIVFGGAQVPHDPARYMQEHPFIDITVRGEGEEAFTEILEHLADGVPPADLPCVNWRAASGDIHVSAQERPFNRDLDQYPSPYLTGLYDELMRSRPDITFQAIIETNRGCPFHCTFCFWGRGGLSRKYRYYQMDRVTSEIDWAGRSGIRYLFNADSNFGMHKRDQEIAEFIVGVKKKYGFPEKFRTCYGKNTDEKIFAIGDLFHQNQLEKGITISYQSLSEQVQKNIKRDNIKLSVASELHAKFNQLDVPVYTELIAGLPGESYDSFSSGIERVLASGLKNQLFIYPCQVYPNTDLADPDYIRNFGIKTRRMRLTEIHGSLRRADWVDEYEDMVIETSAMSVDDWKAMMILSWVTMLSHSLKIAFFVMCWLSDRFAVSRIDFLRALAESPVDGPYPILGARLADMHAKLDSMLNGEGRGCILPEFGEIYWDMEESAFLNLARDFPAFYAELERFVADFLTARDVIFNPQELAEVVAYQRLRMPPSTGTPAARHSFAWSFPEYFDAYFDPDKQELRRSPQSLTVQPRDFDGKLDRFARETILWGRKSGTMLTQVAWRSDAPDQSSFVEKTAISA